MAKKYEKETQDSLQELKTAIRSGTPANLYIFHGEEVFLLHHYFEQLKKLILDDLTESFNFHKLNNETFDIQSFADVICPGRVHHHRTETGRLSHLQVPNGHKMGAILVCTGEMAQ